jgi:ParB family chromosome partitioning protein
VKKIRPGQKIKLTSVEELLGVSNEESAMDIEVVKIQPFRNHPFKVIDDEKMEDLVESIRTNGILSPVLIRPIGNDIYEMVSGHRRMHAAILLGMDRIPAIIREMTDDEAIVKMVDANIQREELLPSEKAFAYKMKMDAMKNQGYRSDLTADSKTSCQFGTKSRADQQVSGQVGESARQVQRFIRLTELIPELLDLVDEGKMGIRPAVELSYLGPRQRDVLEAIEMEQCTPTHEQAKRMRKLYEEQKLTPEAIEAVMMEQKGNQKERIVLRSDRFSRLFPPDLPASKREDYVAAAMEYYARRRQRQRDRDDVR